MGCAGGAVGGASRSLMPKSGEVSRGRDLEIGARAGGLGLGAGVPRAGARGAWYYTGVMRAKRPWLPSQLVPGAPAGRCARCGRLAVIPWTLRRDPYQKRVLRTHVCTECQATEEKPEPE
jgi:hypothetical protein